MNTVSASLIKRAGSRVTSSKFTNGRRCIPVSSSLASPCIGTGHRKDDEDHHHLPQSQSQVKLYSTYSTMHSDRHRLSIVNSRIMSSREYSVTTRSESAVLVLGFGAVAATAKAAQYAVVAYKDWKENQPEEPVDNTSSETSDETASTSSSTGADNTTSSSSSSSAKDKSGGDRKNIFSEFFSVGSKYYEGGFEDKMTKREAALILGVRESSTPKRIKEAHRKLLILNHPDTGGSTYLSGKLNEAKELLLKSKGR